MKEVKIINTTEDVVIDDAEVDYKIHKAGIILIKKANNVECNGVVEAIDAENASIGGKLDLYDISCEFDLNLRKASIKGELDLRKGDIYGNLLCEDAEVGENVYASLVDVQGGVDFRNLKIRGGFLDMSDTDIEKFFWKKGLEVKASDIDVKVYVEEYDERGYRRPPLRSTDEMRKR